MQDTCSSVSQVVSIPVPAACPPAPPLRAVAGSTALAPLARHQPLPPCPPEPQLHLPACLPEPAGHAPWVTPQTSVAVHLVLRCAVQCIQCYNSPNLMHFTLCCVHRQRLERRTPRHQHAQLANMPE